MTTIDFRMHEVKELARGMRNASLQFTPTYGQLYDKRYHKKDAVAKYDEYDILINADEVIDYSKIPPQFAFVKDHGVYLMSMAKDAKRDPKSGMHSVIYAEGFNPSVDEDFYEQSRYALGGDDFAIDIPLYWLDQCDPNEEFFSICFYEQYVWHKGMDMQLTPGEIAEIEDGDAHYFESNMSLHRYGDSYYFNSEGLTLTYYASLEDTIAVFSYGANVPVKESYYLGSREDDPELEAKLRARGVRIDPDEDGSAIFSFPYNPRDLPKALEIYLSEVR